MIHIDKTNLKQKHKDADMHPNLSAYVTEVSLIKPTCDFFVNDDCVHNVWRKLDSGETEDYKQIYRVSVREDGENIGFLSIVREYRGGSNLDVYGVGSFRINKSRGQNDLTTTKHLKVALRNVKKLMVGRDYTELADLIKDSVSNSIHSFVYQAKNQVKWGVDQEELAVDYALLAYHATNQGFDTVILPANEKKYIRRKDLDKDIAKYLEVQTLHTMIADKKGYGVQTFSNGSYAVYNFSNNSIKRYKTTEELPSDIMIRLPMFKVMQMEEVNAAFGCMVKADMYFIVSGDLEMQP
jgi:hypothetical protein